MVSTPLERVHTHTFTHIKDDTKAVTLSSLCVSAFRAGDVGVMPLSF